MTAEQSSLQQTISYFTELIPIRITTISLFKEIVFTKIRGRMKPILSKVCLYCSEKRSGLERQIQRADLTKYKIAKISIRLGDTALCI